MDTDTDQDALDRLAREEILLESQRAAERAELIGPVGWIKCPATNKRFLSNTLIGVMQTNRRRDHSTNYPRRRDRRRSDDYRGYHREQYSRSYRNQHDNRRRPNSIGIAYSTSEDSDELEWVEKTVIKSSTLVSSTSTSSSSTTGSSSSSSNDDESTSSSDDSRTSSSDSSSESTQLSSSSVEDKEEMEVEWVEKIIANSPLTVKKEQTEQTNGKENRDTSSEIANRSNKEKSVKRNYKRTTKTEETDENDTISDE